VNVSVAAVSTRDAPELRFSQVSKRLKCHALLPPADRAASASSRLIFRSSRPFSSVAAWRSICNDRTLSDLVILRFDEHYLAYLSSGALHAALTGWAAREFTDAPDVVADFLIRTLAPVTNSLLSAAVAPVVPWPARRRQRL